MDSYQDFSFILQSFIKREIFKMRYPAYFKESQSRRKLITPAGYSLMSFDEHRCIFVHVPKCAGISISKSLFGNKGGGHRRIQDYQFIFNTWDFMNYFKFTIVRNPWDRVFSAFTFLKNGGINEDDEIWAKKNLGQYQDFNTFASHWLNKSNIKLRIVFSPQMEYLRLFNNRLGLDFIGSYENLSKDFSYICKKLKIKAVLSRLNISRPKNDDYRMHYTDKTRQIVANIYEDDIKTLGYSFDRLPPTICTLEHKC